MDATTQLEQNDIDMLRQEIRRKVNASYMKMRAKRPVGLSLDDVNNLIDQLIECDSILDDINSSDQCEFSSKFFDKIMEIQNYLSQQNESQSSDKGVQLKMATMQSKQVPIVFVKTPMGLKPATDSNNTIKLAKVEVNSHSLVEPIKLTPAQLSAASFVNETVEVNYEFQPMSLEEQAANLEHESELRRENKLRLNVISEYIINGEFVAGLVVFPKEWEALSITDTTINALYGQLRKVAKWFHKFLEELYVNPTPLFAIRNLVQVWVSKFPNFHYRYLVLKEKCERDEKLGLTVATNGDDGKGNKEPKLLNIYYRWPTVTALLFNLILNIRNTSDKIIKQKGMYNYKRPNNVKRLFGKHCRPNDSKEKIAKI